MTSGFHLCDRSLSLLCLLLRQQPEQFSCIYSKKKKKGKFLCVLQKLWGGKFSETSESFLTWRTKLRVHQCTCPVCWQGVWYSALWHRSLTRWCLGRKFSSCDTSFPSTRWCSSFLFTNQTQAGWNFLLQMTFIQNVKILIQNIKQQIWHVQHNAWWEKWVFVSQHIYLKFLFWKTSVNHPTCFYVARLLLVSVALIDFLRLDQYRNILSSSN